MQQTRQSIRFALNGEPVEVGDATPATTLLEWLRTERRLTGTKEGCAEGDCGACTVLVARREPGGALSVVPCNSCIRLLPTLDGCGVLTVEGLGGAHPVQAALVEHHGSQCGFCTPGFVMSMVAALAAGRRGAAGGSDSSGGTYSSTGSREAGVPDVRGARDQRIDTTDALAGNLCRCTGYRPLVDALRSLRSSCAGGRLPAWLDELPARDPLELAYAARGVAWHAPVQPAGVDALLAAHPHAWLLAGGTDAGLWVTKQLREPSRIVWLGAVDALHRVSCDDAGIDVGAAVSLADAFGALHADYPELARYWARFASPAIRATGTLVGNLANGSPIGDAAPVLIALDAQVLLRRHGAHGAVTRWLPLERLYRDYRVQDRAPGEWIERVRVPRRRPGLRLVACKLSRRLEQDVAAVSLAVALELRGGRLSDVRLAFGGMAGVVKRAAAAEAALEGQAPSVVAFARAGKALAGDFSPLSDLRASARYRLDAAAGLLLRAGLHLCGGQAADPLQALDPGGDVALPAVQDASPAHDSAGMHAAGAARYTDDLPEPAGTVHAAIGYAGLAHARIDALDLSAVHASPGVVAVLRAADIPGDNNYGGIVHDDPILADGVVHYEGQPLFLAVARSHRAARVAARRARIDATPLPAVFSIDEAIAAQSWVLPPVTVTRGDAAAAIAGATHRLDGRAVVGGQDHFYLEGQVALAVGQDDGGMHVFASTQHPTEVQHQVAHALGLPASAVRVECRRMGGGFGGKESQPALLACLAAVAARRLGVAVKLRLDRDDDMVVTGKRHPFQADWQVGFDADGRIRGLDVTLASDCGCSADLSGPVNDRAVCHLDNAYFLEHVHVRSLRCRTNKVSNTAFRGFGGPQGMFVIEQVVDAIAAHLQRDPLAVRTANLYRSPGRDVTHYGQVVGDDVLPRILRELAESSDYGARRDAIRAFNRSSLVLRRGIALTPVKFGISFNAPFLNQAGALLHLYSDGSLLLNHGGTEMGQGLYTKVAQVVAREFDVPIERVRVSPADTHRVPNTSATAASCGSDLNGMAAFEACQTLRRRLLQWLAARWGVPIEALRWRHGAAHADAGGEPRSMTLTEMARLAWMARVPLSAQGFYRTPEIHWDSARFTGHPFYYFACGAAVSEVAIDTLTGEHRLLAVDILHDVGTSMNPALDLGQIEGGFVQGAGWLTSEALVWDAAGRLSTHAPSTYKIPTAADVPPRWRVALLQGEPNRAPTIYRSKAVGEPPLMLALSVYHALRDAVASVGAPGRPVALQAPATPEAVLHAVRQARQR